MLLVPGARQLAEGLGVKSTMKAAKGGRVDKEMPGGSCGNERVAGISHPIGGGSAGLSL